MLLEFVKLPLEMLRGIREREWHTGISPNDYTVYVVGTSLSILFYLNDLLR